VKWSEYNESLVRRGEILLGFDVINNWDNELEEMNKDKVGEPFHYPKTFLLSQIEHILFLLLSACLGIFAVVVLSNR